MEWTRGAAIGALAGMLSLAGTPAWANDIRVEVTVSESSPMDPGTSRSGDALTTVIDLGGHAIPVGTRGHPLLKVTGAGLGPWQFTRITNEDPDHPSSAVTAATLDVIINDMNAGDVITLTIEDGSGDSGGNPMATEYPTHFSIDTGAAVFNLPKDGSLVSDCWSGGTQVLAAGAHSGFYVIDANGVTYSSFWGVTQATMKRNGPACTCIELSGTLADQAGNELSTLVMELWAYAGQTTLQGRIEMQPFSPRSNLQIVAAHVIVYGSSDPSQALDESSKRRAVLEDDCYTKTVPNVGFGGPALLPYPQSVGVERMLSPAGFSAVTRWPAPDWPQSVEPSGTSWVSVQLWPRELPLTSGGRQWSMNEPGRFVEFTLGVHEVVPGDLENWGHRKLCPLEAVQVPQEDQPEIDPATSPRPRPSSLRRARVVRDRSEGARQRPGDAFHPRKGTEWRGRSGCRDEITRRPLKYLVVIEPRRVTRIR